MGASCCSCRRRLQLLEEEADASQPAAASPPVVDEDLVERIPSVPRYRPSTTSLTELELDEVIATRSPTAVQAAQYEKRERPLRERRRLGEDC